LRWSNWNLWKSKRSSLIFSRIYMIFLNLAGSSSHYNLVFEFNIPRGLRTKINEYSYHSIEEKSFPSFSCEVWSL
jgi:hypothetical protein